MSDQNINPSIEDEIFLKDIVEFDRWRYSGNRISLGTQSF